MRPIVHNKVLTLYMIGYGHPIKFKEQAPTQGNAVYISCTSCTHLFLTNLVLYAQEYTNRLIRAEESSFASVRLL